MNNPHEKVGPTAWGIAYRRAGCDIPYAKEIYDELVKVMTSEERVVRWKLSFRKKSSATPQFEARYKLLNRILRKTGIKQIIELASGIFCPRGIEMTQDKTVTYVELDRSWDY